MSTTSTSEKVSGEFRKTECWRLYRDDANAFRLVVDYMQTLVFQATLLMEIYASCADAGVIRRRRKVVADALRYARKLLLYWADHYGVRDHWLLDTRVRMAQIYFLAASKAARKAGREMEALRNKMEALRNA